MELCSTVLWHCMELCSVPSTETWYRVEPNQYRIEPWLKPAHGSPQRPQTGPIAKHRAHTFWTRKRDLITKKAIEFNSRGALNSTSKCPLAYNNNNSNIYYTSLLVNLRFSAGRDKNSDILVCNTIIQYHFLQPRHRLFLWALLCQMGSAGAH